MKAGLLSLIILIPLFSCNSVKNYFRDPETETLVETIHSSMLTGYCANIAMSVMSGRTYSFVNASRSNQGYPCTTIMVIDLEKSDYPYGNKKAMTVTIAGLWPDASTAVLSLLYTDYHIGSNTLDFLGIETIPVMRDGENIHIALAGQDIRLNPDSHSILTLDLTNLQFESELVRLGMQRTEDVYVAVLQNAFLVDINTHGTYQDMSDDDYTLTGGGQLVEVAGSAAEIVQQALVDVSITPSCLNNPVQGMALVQVTGLEDEGFPELGTVVLEFTDDCDGSAKVCAATGMYIISNGKRIDFPM